MNQSEWLPADAVCALLNIKPQTLYAYVSRGLIRAKNHPHNPRKCLYSRFDVDALQERNNRSKRRADVAASAISWGEPVLESGISTVRDGRLVFGNLPATQFAESGTLEDVAAHHWQGSCVSTDNAAAEIPVEQDAKTRGFVYLAKNAGKGMSTMGRTREALCREGGQLLSDFANAIIGKADTGPIHKRLAKYWGLEEADADFLRQCLVLISDHELNASTFAVRVAISTGAPLPAALLAGYSTLAGPLHGEAGRQTREVLKALHNGQAPAEAVANVLMYEKAEFGFGHRLYPDGDSRALHLLPQLDLPKSLKEGIAGIEAITGKRVNVDAAFSAFALTRKLPADTSFIIFAMGRLAGWIGHAFEQTSSGALIRPRARYTGFN